jgi:hypothetical protein
MCENNNIYNPNKLKRNWRLSQEGNNVFCITVIIRIIFYLFILLIIKIRPKWSSRDSFKEHVL